MRKLNEPYRRYNIYIPVRVYEIIAEYATQQKHSISQECERALGWYSEKIKEFNETMQADAERLQAQYGMKKEEEK